MLMLRAKLTEPFRSLSCFPALLVGLELEVVVLPVGESENDARLLRVGLNNGSAASVSASKRNSWGSKWRTP